MNGKKGELEEGRQHLEIIRDLEGVSKVDPEAVEAFLMEKFKTKEKAYWIKALQDSGVGAVALSALSELREKYSSHEETGPHGSGSTFQFTRYDNHPSGHRIDITAPCSIRPRYAAFTVPPPAEKYGKETREILSEMGYADADIDQMIADNVVSERWGEQYLPD